ncbi:MAG: hypothetical protein H6638_06305 [Ardenticatenales bacterium]|nr:hypothetical protein [Ardenticatenales bacterium]
MTRRMIDVEIVPLFLPPILPTWVRRCAESRAGGAKAVQIDVMDGHFVPNRRLGRPW